MFSEEVDITNIMEDSCTATVDVIASFTLAVAKRRGICNINGI